MAYLLVMLGLMTIFLIVFILFLKWYTWLCFKIMVTDKLAVVNHILEQGTLPRQWKRNAVVYGACRGLSALDTPALKISRHKLKRLIGAVGYNPYFNNDGNGEERVEALRDVLHQWQTAQKIVEIS